MFERFTSAAREVVVRAVQEAKHQKSATITAEHLALALAADSTTPAGRLLSESGVQRSDIAAAFEQAHDRGGLSESDTNALRELGIDVHEVVDSVEKSLGPGARHVPFSHEAKQVLEHTLREAVEVGDRHLGDEHLLLALIARNSVIADLLENHDITAVTIRSSLRQAG
jgi:ATP-dependent Clp protease ATP-binding subunit ClpA